LATAVKVILVVTVLITVGALATWQVTGGDYYTKFEVVEEVEREIDPNDPLAGTGFYDGESQTETVVRKEFRFGLLPTPSGLFDKHMISVATAVSPFWVLTIAGLWWMRRRARVGNT
jgi:hypothetical protein